MVNKVYQQFNVPKIIRIIFCIALVRTINNNNNEVSFGLEIQTLSRELLKEIKVACNFAVTTFG